MPFCCGIEMIHAFSLVHDDLPCMDDDDFRRGRPSLHRKFDEATAVLAADALLAYAFELFTTGAAPPGRRLAATAAIAAAVGPLGMAGGQMLDVEASARATKARLAAVPRLKTAEFLAASMVSGGILAGATRQLCDKLRAAGLRLGMLFQTTDDLIDAGQDSDRGSQTVLNSRNIENVRRQAVKQAASAERSFAALGPKFLLLAALPHLLLRRRE